MKGNDIKKVDHLIYMRLVNMVVADELEYKIGGAHKDMINERLNLVLDNRMSNIRDMQWPG